MKSFIHSEPITLGRSREFDFWPGTLALAMHHLSSSGILHSTFYIDLQCTRLVVFLSSYQSLTTLVNAYHPHDVFTEVRRNGNQLHRVVENTGGICERELKTSRMYPISPVYVIGMDFMSHNSRALKLPRFHHT